MNDIQLAFDYQQVPEIYRVEIQKKTAEIRIIVKQTGQGIIDIGQRLIEVKEMLPRGSWLKWLETEFGWSERTAYNFINVSAKFATVASLENIGAKALYLLAAPSTPEEAREDAIEIAEAGEKVSHQTVQELTQAHQHIEILQNQIESLKTDLSEPQEPIVDTEAIEALELVIDELKDIVSKKNKTLGDLNKTIKRLTIEYENLQKKSIKTQILPKKKYQTIVVDPPWPMKKIQREERPNQAEWDYPKMTIEEIMALPIEAIADENGCHLYLWTTQKYLPNALNIVAVWGFKYQCIMTWVKNVGMTPFSWMYSTEHVVFATKGSLELLKKGLRLDFNGKVREHSRKPDEFYTRVSEASPGPRIDYFSREAREGFEQYGNESDKFQKGPGA